MRFTIVIALIWLTSYSSYAEDTEQAKAPQNTILTAEEIKNDVETLRSTFSHIHPGYTRYESLDAMNLAWDGIIEKANKNQGMRLGDFYPEVQLALSLIRCDHTKAEVPESIKEQRKSMQAYFPFKWEIVGDRAYVKFALDETSIQAGDEITAIDGISIRQYIEMYSKYTSIDGFNEHTRTNEIAFSSEFMGGVVEHFAALTESPSPVSQVEILRSGTHSVVTVNKLGFIAWRKFLQKNEPFYRNFKDEVSLQLLDANTAILNVNTFVNYRQPVEPSSVYDPIFQKIEDSGVKNLILDLRQNGGGSSEPAAALLSYFISKPESISREVRVKTYDYGEYKPLLQTWDSRALNPDPSWFTKTREGDYRLTDDLAILAKKVSPSPLAFSGHLVVLTSSNNSSGSASFLAKLRDLGNATFIGEPTGGSSEGPTSGIIFFVTLPHSGIVARLPAQRDYNDINSFTFGRGVIPDIQVAPQLADIQSNRDVILETAISFINQNREKI